MYATLINAAAVIVGGFMGLLFRKGLPKKLSDALMTGLGFCVMYIGLRGMFDGRQTMVLILSVVLGALVGTLLDLDGKLHLLGEKIERKFAHGNGESRIAEGFVNASLLFCVGAMAVVGALDAGLTGNGETILTKSAIDGVTSIVFGSQFGAGVMLSAIPILLYQGAITLLAQWVQPFLSGEVIAEMNCCGSLLILAIGLNMIGVTKIKVMNYVPAIFFAGLLAWGWYAVFPV